MGDQPHVRRVRRPGSKNAARVLALALVAIVAASAPASAQFQWPWSKSEPARPPMPQEPVYRPAPAQQPPPMAQPNAPPVNWSTKNPICLQLEQRLLQEGQKGGEARDKLPQIENEMRQIERTNQANAGLMDRSCYESFLFTRTFRSTTQCKELARAVDASKRRLGELEAQRQILTATSGRSFRDDIVRELARNNCGANYVQEASRQQGGSGTWQEDDSGGFWGNGGGSSGGGYVGSNTATYRTVCVRLCDGYYFPVSFSTLPSHFAQDDDLCQSKCAAPVELYSHPNPGGAMEQATSVKTQELYTKLKTAFRYRKEYVQGCSCKEAEYVPQTPVPGDKRAEALGGGATVGGGGWAAKTNSR